MTWKDFSILYHVQMPKVLLEDKIMIMFKDTSWVFSAHKPKKIPG